MMRTGRTRGLGVHDRVCLGGNLGELLPVIGRYRGSVQPMDDEANEHKHTQYFQLKSWSKERRSDWIQTHVGSYTA